jgi:hypothetical protein
MDSKMNLRFYKILLEEFFIQSYRCVTVELFDFIFFYDDKIMKYNV